MTAGVFPLTVLQLSDLHLFAEDNQDLLGLNTSGSLRQVLESVKTLSPAPDLILLTGDLTQDESEEAYQAVKALFADFDVPIYSVPGNHDDPELMASHLTSFPFQIDRTFASGGWQFILLDSSVRQCVQGALSKETLARLDAALGACPRPTAIALHHPAYPVQSRWLDDSLTNYEELWGILDRHPQVRIVLSGHVHQEMTFSRRGIQYLSTPSTCVQFKPRSQDFAVDDRHPGFRLLTLFPDGSFQSWVERVPVKQTADLQSAGY
ncbi:MAG: 3',5'-cyclic-AMP phosphodiesterase [Cyanobacteria bacterium P01_F01_bin.42]